MTYFNLKNFFPFLSFPFISLYSSFNWAAHISNCYFAGQGPDSRKSR